jgi:hypothetical protein
MIFHPDNIKFLIQTNLTEEDPSNVYQIDKIHKIKVPRLGVGPDVVILQVDIYLIRKYNLSKI